MRRAPVAAVAALVALGVTAATVRWRRPPRSAPAAAAPGSTPLAPPASAVPAAPEEPVGGDTAVRPGRMLHGDPRRTGRSGAAAPLELPVVVWTRNVGGPVEAQVASSPDGATLYVASLGGTLQALARADGAPRWTVPLGDRGYSAPCVADDGTIYVGSDARKLLAVSPQGVVRWSLDTDGDADTGPLLLADGTIVFAAGRMLYALWPGGSVRFRFAARRKIFTAPALAPGGRLVFGSQDHHAYVLGPGGELAFRVDLGADVDGAPAVGDDGAVYFGTDAGEVVRLDPAEGTIAWRARLGGFVRGPLSVARNGDVLAGVYGPTPRAVRLRASDGSVAAQVAIQGTGAREFGVHGGAVEDARGSLLFGAQDDALYCTDGAGRVRWRLLTGGDVDAPVTVLSDGSVVVASDDGNVTLLAGR